MLLDDVCTYVTSSAASRHSAVKLTTDSYQFSVAHLNLRVRKVQKYGETFSKSSSIYQTTFFRAEPSIHTYEGHLESS